MRPSLEALEAGDDDNALILVLHIPHRKATITSVGRFLADPREDTATKCSTTY
ncbi:unnamed protein product [Nippostrongylus brasiliensis]|uniref:Protein-serine/threonine phosphatase n=1 Tax=Nippostrongylus brasiliensis TaxID=27835 RepID=A0A0N4YLQ6_NIPBR|nr:unnamed protein product [Nippostrongylus brasiliensis]